MPEHVGCSFMMCSSSTSQSTFQEECCSKSNSLVASILATQCMNPNLPVCDMNCCPLLYPFTFLPRPLLVGLAYDVHQHVLSTDVRGEGLHTGPPGFEFVIFPAVYRSISYTSIECLNRDGVEIDMRVSFQYRPIRANLYPIALQFRNATMYGEIIEQQGTAVVYSVCGQFDTEQFQTERSAVEDAVRTGLQNAMTQFYTEVASVQIGDISRPSTFEQAVRRKETARENVEVARNERERRIIQANTTLLENRTQAGIILDRARTNASIVTDRAQAEARAIVDEFAAELRTYSNIMKENNLTIEGLLAYLGSRIIEGSEDEVFANMDHPAKPSYADRL